jgi:hypothetical protein
VATQTKPKLTFTVQRASPRRFCIHIWCGESWAYVHVPYTEQEAQRVVDRLNAFMSQEAAHDAP